MLQRNLINAIRAALAAEADSERAAGAQAYMKSEMPFYGVPVPRVRKVTWERCKESPLLSMADFTDTVGGMFMEAAFREERYGALAIASYKGHRRFQTAKALPLYKKLIVTGAWWDLVDEASVRVGEVLLSDPAAVKPQLLRWANGQDIWLRRASIICQRSLKEQADLALLEACIAPSLGRPEFFLRKGIGWALRSASYAHPDWVRQYVHDHGDELSPLSRREALKNLERRAK